MAGLRWLSLASSNNGETLRGRNRLPVSPGGVGSFQQGNNLPGNIFWTSRIGACVREGGFLPRLGEGPGFRSTLGPWSLCARFYRLEFVACLGMRLLLRCALGLLVEGYSGAGSVGKFESCDRVLPIIWWSRSAEIGESWTCLFASRIHPSPMVTRFRMGLPCSSRPRRKTI